MILLAFAEGPAHGYEIKKRAEERSQGSVELDAGSLYRSIADLVDRGLIEQVEADPDSDERDTRRRYYALTDAGREVLAAEAQTALESLWRPVIRNHQKQEVGLLRPVFAMPG